MPAAVVLGMTTNGLAIARSLGRRGIPVFKLDSPRARPAIRSRYGTTVPMPDVGAEPELWATTLEELARRQPVPPVAFPTCDEHVLFLSRHRERLSSALRFRLPADEIVRQLCDKGEQYELLAGLGWPLPRSVVAEDGADIERLAQAEVGFPCVLKPRSSHRWLRHGTGRKLTIAHDAAELRRNYDAMRATGEPLLLQELVPGDDSAIHGCIAYCVDGEPVAMLTKQKLRQYPVGFGNGCYQVSTHNREVAELSTAILRSLSFEGMAAIEFKWDHRDRRYKLIEINPRGVSGNQLAVDSGLDLPYVAYQVARGAGAPPPVDYRAGVRFLHLPWDLLAFRALRHRREITLLGWLRSLCGVRSFALFSPRDPAPLLFYVLMVIGLWRRGALAGKLLR